VCFLAIWISSFEKVRFSSLTNFFIESLIFFCEFSFLSSLYILIISSLSYVQLAKIFLPLCGWSLQFRNHFFCCAEAF
jgi:hypothetical protein